MFISIVTFLIESKHDSPAIRHDLTPFLVGCEFDEADISPQNVSPAKL